MVFKRVNDDSVTMTIEITNKENDIVLKIQKRFKIKSKEAVFKFLLNDFYASEWK